MENKDKLVISIEDIIEMFKMYSKYVNDIVEKCEKLERENFGLRQQVTNLREKDEKRWL